MEPWSMVLGVVLLALGAVGATFTQRELEQTGRGRWVVPALVPFGVLVGAGAALVRGWALGPAMATGAVVLPVVAVVARLVEVRRRR
jgi:hypothetical protein